MESWQQSLQHSLTSVAQLARHFPIERTALEAVVERYPLRITPYYLGLIREVGDPIWRQCVPDPRELSGDALLVDPLGEERRSPLPAVIHRYPDRVVFLVSGACAVYCRFCTRKRKVGCPAMQFGRDDLLAGLDYIASTPEIRDVLLSGGDPLLLPDAALAELLEGLRRIPHLEIIRIGSRVPVTLPERITPELCRLLGRFAPLYFNTHFNHPRELTPEAAAACTRLAEAGIPLGNQTVLLQGVNDDPVVMAELLRGLLRIRVRPYYLHHMDLAQGTGHFRTRIETGLAIIAALRGQVSGLAIPHYVIDTPGGRGKVPLQPDYLRQLGDRVVLRTPDGEELIFPNRPAS